ncbi:MAG: hypothetical protein IT210_02000 [Armatimonadetes bacterium]|nr:hypothetical protein [Armatimonadota bacterium]
MPSLHLPLLALSAAVLLLGLPDAAHKDPRMESITREGTTWTASTWGYNSPKLLYDGKRLFAVSLAGGGPDHDAARLYWRDAEGWHPGAAITPIYQPATILLDSEGHINLFCTDRGKRGYHWRSVRAGDVSEFRETTLTEPERFGYGYLGTGRGKKMIALTGLDQDYRMWLAYKRSPGSPWSRPYLLAPSQRRVAPWQCPLYPVVMPEGNKIHVIYSNCPDGSVHNTYNKVEYALFDTGTKRVIRRDIVAEGPVGEMTYGLDALLDGDGSLYVLYMSGVYAYGEKREDGDRRKGLYCAALRSGGRWESRRITGSSGTGQLYSAPDGRLYVYESTASDTLRYISADHGQSWRADGPAWSGIGYFLYILKPNSGSAGGGRLLAVQSVPLPAGGGSRYGLDYIELPEG